LVAIGVALGLLVVNIFQLRATQKAADTAKTSADMEKRRAEDSEEATCMPTGDIGVGETVYRFFLPNSGKVNARNLHGQIELSLNSLPSNEPLRSLAKIEISQDELAAGQRIEKHISMDIASDWEKLINSDETLVATGEIRYDNGFGRIRSSPMCYAIVWIPSPNDPNNRAHGSGLDCDRLQEWLLTNLPKLKTPQ
jgi:hypothetical protein